MTTQPRNVDRATVEGFGKEWTRFDQSDAPSGELESIFAQYFSVFPWDLLSNRAQGFDAGCGSGRWASFVAPRVGVLHCIDASPAAIEVARRNLAATANCVFHVANIDELPLSDAAMDFGYSLGVLHHLPDPLSGLRACARKLKPNAPFLVYLYYAFDNRPMWFRALWRSTELGRVFISRLPFWLRCRVTDAIAVVVYWPLARLALLAERFGCGVDALPLASYRRRSLYTMRTDALDRFGTRLEHRLSRAGIQALLESAGFVDVHFREAPPYWCAVGFKHPGSRTTTA
jgi:SAM-dependent methyltransferase